MQFNTGQVQELAGIRREQLRHWRKVLPPLGGRDGRTDLYSFGEVLALAALAVLVEHMGISVSRLSGCASDLFALFTEVGDISALPTSMHVSHLGELSLEPPTACIAFTTVRVDSVFAGVRERLAPEQRQQLSLPLDM